MSLRLLLIALAAAAMVVSPSPLRAQDAAELGDRDPLAPSPPDLPPTEADPAPGDVPTDPAPPAAASEDEGPWRLSKAAGLPDWLHIGGTSRARYEYLWNQFRVGREGNGRGLSLRTTILLELRFDPVRVGAELMDSRAYFLDSDTPVNTGIVNPVELLQAYAALDFDDGQLGEQIALTLRAGRLTMDFGSRRLVARNRFRNTINAFTGAEAELVVAGHSLRGTYALPIQRLPSDRGALEDNDVHFDHEHEDVHFWGLFYSSPDLGPIDLRVEAYVFGLNEDDSSERATRDRELYTPGFRIWRKKGQELLDFQLEAVAQFGHSKASSSTSAPTLDHRAFFVHATVGYTLDAPWKPRFALQGDYASGDYRGSDDENQRFDTLFGARRFEFGPTGFVGAFARGNLQSLGLRLEVAPLAHVTAHIAYRPFWLARKQDAWTTSGVRDPSGRSGRFLGHQVEARVRYELLPGNLRLEGGFALLARGRFAREAPTANAGEPFVLYAQAVLTF